MYDGVRIPGIKNMGFGDRPRWFFLRVPSTGEFTDLYRVAAAGIDMAFEEAEKMQSPGRPILRPMPLTASSLHW